MFDYEIKVTPKDSMYHVELVINRELVYEDNFSTYVEAATAAEQRIQKEYHKG